ncbi:hypothetical protein FRX31_028367, partial [Thalictrum thalictroides]
LLDPERKYFNCWKIIAREDSTSKSQKSLDKIPVPAKVVVILELDDREDDESENRGALAEALDKLKLIHEMVFYPENDAANLSKACIEYNQDNRNFLRL